MTLNPHAELGADSWLRTIWLWVAVFVFLLPVSWKVGGVPVAVNYTFFALLLLVPQIRQCSPWVLIACAYYFACFLFSVVLEHHDVDGFFARQSLSFVVFFGALLVSTVRMPFNFELLARATVVVSVCYSMLLVLFLVVHGTHIIANAGMSKSMPSEWVPDWPQRYIVVVMFGVILSLYLSRRSGWWLLPAAICGFCVTATHSLAAYSAILVGLSSLAIFHVVRREWRGLFGIAIVLALTFSMVALAARSDTIQISKESAARIENLVSFGRSGELMPESGEHAPEGSRLAQIYMEGGAVSGKVRLVIWTRLVKRMVDDRMWFGSGFAGPYLYDQEIGSAHSQYVDVLFRAGPLGLILYLVLCALLLQRAYRHSPELACGVLVWLVFGVFHETTKYPYGAFLFFTLLSMAWYGWESGSDFRRVKNES